jgi:hypothetical protein
MKQKCGPSGFASRSGAPGGIVTSISQPCTEAVYRRCIILACSHHVNEAGRDGCWLAVSCIHVGARSYSRNVESPRPISGNSRTTPRKACTLTRISNNLPTSHKSMHQVCFYRITPVTLRYNHPTTQQPLRDPPLRLYRLLYPRILELPLESRENLEVE